MRVRIDPSDEGLGAELREADDFKSFSVEVPDGLEVDEHLVTQDGAVSFASADQAWVDQTWLREAGGFLPDSASGQSFEKMLAFAAEHGWLDPENGKIAAHVERS